MTPWRKGAHACRAIARMVLAGTHRTSHIDIQKVVMQSRAASMTTLDKLDPSLTGQIRISTMICYASWFFPLRSSPLLSRATLAPRAVLPRLASFHSGDSLSVWRGDPRLLGKVFSCVFLQENPCVMMAVRVGWRRGVSQRADVGEYTEMARQPQNAVGCAPHRHAPARRVDVSLCMWPRPTRASGLDRPWCDDPRGGRRSRWYLRYVECSAWLPGQHGRTAAPLRRRPGAQAAISPTGACAPGWARCRGLAAARPLTVSSLYAWIST